VRVGLAQVPDRVPSLGISAGQEPLRLRHDLWLTLHIIGEKEVSTLPLSFGENCRSVLPRYSSDQWEEYLYTKSDNPFDNDYKRIHDKLLFLFSWKDPNCSFRTDSQLRLTNIPTLLEWGTVENDGLYPTKLSVFILFRLNVLLKVNYLIQKWLKYFLKKIKLNF